MNSIFHTKIDKSGRVTLPAEVLSELHLEPGTTLLIKEKDGKINLEPVTEEPVLITKDGILVLHAQVTEDISNIVEKDREKRIAAIIGESCFSSRSR